MATIWSSSGGVFLQRGAASAKNSKSRRRISAMSQGDPIREWILKQGGASTISRVSPVGGGCINTANRYETDAGSFFVKTNSGIDSSMFEAEAAGLNAMFHTNTIRVPKPLKVGNLPRGGSYIIMECIEFGGAGAAGQRELGRKLAEMHKEGISTKGFGFEMDNTIGSTPQLNTWTQDWITFFQQCRIGPQLDMIKSNYGDDDLYKKGQKLLQVIPSVLKDVEAQPCLLHGDLWSGNVAYDRDHNPVILDPACYYGHNEAEFGMSWCASFSDSFYKEYFKVMPKQKGFEDRVELYKLYHYLNHYNLFGRSYRSQCISIINQFVR